MRELIGNGGLTSWAPHPDLGEDVIAVVVPRAGTEISEEIVTAALWNVLTS